MGGNVQNVQFSIKGPIPVQCNLETININAGERLKRVGCSIIDLQFNQPSQFRELVFTNFYTACISIYVKRVLGVGLKTAGTGITTGGGGNGAHHQGPHLQRYATVDGSIGEKHATQTSTSPHMDDMSITSSTRSRRMHSGKQRNLIEVGDRPWECSVYMKHLMPWPHFESGSQDFFSIQAPESVVEWKDVVLLRLVMHQPSSVWKQFSVEDISVLRSLPNRGFITSEPGFHQNDNRLLALKGNTKRMLSGLTVEPQPEPESQENDRK